MKNKLWFLNISVFLQTQLYLLPFLFLFYQHCGLDVGDFFLFQGVFALSGLLFEVPFGYLGDVFSKRNVLILSYGFFVLRCLLWLFFAQYGYWILLAGEILSAAQKASFAGVADSYVYEYLSFYGVSKKMKKRYGKMNFFMSFGTALSALLATCFYAKISGFTLSRYGYNYGFAFLIGLELLLNLIAIVLLCRLPKLPRRSAQGLNLSSSYIKLFQVFVGTLKNKNIRYYILFSGLLTATTLVFSWSFQPIMKLLYVPVSAYGLVYFINHVFRAMASLYSDKISRSVPLPKLAMAVFVGFVVCFILSFYVSGGKSLPVWSVWGYFVFVSLVIGGQLAFKLLQDCRLHKFVSDDVRATSSSVSAAISRLYSGAFFILMKVLLDGVSIQKSLAVCLGVYLLASFPLKKIYSSLRKDMEDATD